MKKTGFLLVTLLLSALIFSGCQTQEIAQPVLQQNIQQPTVPQIPETTITLLAVGDNILHDTVFHAAQKGNTYDFTPMYRLVQPLIAAADLAYVNQEAPIGGDGYTASSYPHFNAPPEIGRDLTAVGFDIFNLANNHMMDQGAKATIHTIDYLHSLDVTTIGAYTSQEQQANHPTIIEKNGIKVGWLAYTYGTNGLAIPASQPYLISISDPATITKEVTALRGKCDVLLVSMHWGLEYQLQPSAQQKELAQLLNTLGVDVVIGTHPHVIQPVEWLTAADGHRTFVAYSLGNFLSSQNKTNTMLGGMLALKITRDHTGHFTISEPGIMPIVTHFEQRWKNFTVYPLDQYSESLAAKHRLNSIGQPISKAGLTQVAIKSWGEFYRTEDQLKNILTPFR